MKSLPPLSRDSILADLPMHDFRVPPSMTGALVEEQFNQQPDLPGVIVLAPDVEMMMISRRRFYKHMSEPYGRELFLNRPIQYFLKLTQLRQPLHCLQLPYVEKVDTAVSIALRRPKAELYEPIVVVFREDELPDFRAYFLLDSQVLLRAQSQILTQLNQEIHEQRQQTQKNLSKLKREQKRVQEYTQMLEHQHKTIQERNAQLQNQKARLTRQSKELEHFNHHFKKVGQQFSTEAEQAFQATFSGVNEICLNTNRILQIGEFLMQELGTVHTVSRTVNRVNQQVQQLSVQASIIVNRVSSGHSGFSAVTSEISKLVNQSSEAANQMERLANRFKSRIENLSESAESGGKAAESLLENIHQVEAALHELEMLLS